MNNIIERIKNHFSESIQIKINAADLILPTIGAACERIVNCLLEGHKILVCGNGGSACSSLHFSAQMINRFKHERPSLPVISLTGDASILTSIANDNNYHEIFTKQLRAFAHPGDILLTISTSGNSLNILNVIKTAHDRHIPIIALTGYDGGKIANLLKEEDIEIRVPAYDIARIQETHLLILHCLCDIVDYQLFGHGD